MHVMVVTYGEPKKGYLNFTQSMALLIWPPLLCLEFIINQYNFNEMKYGNRYRETRHHINKNFKFIKVKLITVISFKRGRNKINLMVNLTQLQLKLIYHRHINT